MLGNASPTPYDLRFSLFGIPVRVHPLFWLMTLLLGGSLRELNAVLLWVVCVFVSILVHEFGHALTARYFGWHPEVVLYSCGGYASFTPTWGYTTARRVLVTAAGPGAGFVLFGLVLAVQVLIIYFQLVPRNESQRLLLSSVIGNLLFINLAWGILNLVPIYPLDGGQIARDLLTHYRGNSGYVFSLRLSILLGGVLAAFFFATQQTFSAILFAMLAVQNYQELQGARRW